VSTVAGGARLARARPVGFRSKLTNPRCVQYGIEVGIEIFPIEIFQLFKAERGGWRMSERLIAFKRMVLGLPQSPGDYAVATVTASRVAFPSMSRC